VDYEKPEVIEQEMERTRQSLSDKVCTLENEVIGKIEDTSSAVTSTVERVQGIFDHVEGFFSDTATGVRDGISTMVRSADPERFIARHPWASVGGAALAGMVTGWLVLGRRVEVAQGTGRHAAFTPAPPSPAPAAAPMQLPGWLNNILDRLSGEARRIGETALGVASDSIRRVIETQVPQQLANLVEPAPAACSTDGYPNGRRTATPVYERSEPVV
jgi:ElaB/YqjD/DUF883 family membrane-anchored ribosome-binding protein